MLQKSSRARGAHVFALGLLAGCAPSTNDPFGSSFDGPVAALAIAPDSAWLVQLDTAYFSPVGRSLEGDSVRPVVTWHAKGGAIRGNGRFVAGLDTGAYLITARSVNGIEAQATVFLGFRIVEIVITPKSVTLKAGQRQQFTARGVTFTGDTVPVHVVWSATGGTITQDGLFTATTTGKVLVTAELAPDHPKLSPRRAVTASAGLEIGG